MNATTTKKMAEFNAACAAVSEWQRGAIGYAEMQSRLGVAMSQPEIDAIKSRLYRTMSETDVAQTIADAIGL